MCRNDLFQNCPNPMYASYVGLLLSPLLQLHGFLPGKSGPRTHSDSSIFAEHAICACSALVESQDRSQIRSVSVSRMIIIDPCHPTCRMRALPNSSAQKARKTQEKVYAKQVGPSFHPALAFELVCWGQGLMPWVQWGFSAVSEHTQV